MYYIFIWAPFFNLKLFIFDKYSMLTNQVTFFQVTKFLIYSSGPSPFRFHHNQITKLYPQLTSSIFIAQVGEPPHVSQPYDLPGHGQQEFKLVGPLAPGEGFEHRDLCFPVLLGLRVVVWVHQHSGGKDRCFVSTHMAGFIRYIKLNIQIFGE